MPAYVIRHAEAGHPRDWHGDDRLRPLTESGKVQAEGLAANLKGEPIQTIISSPYRRCLQTVAPLALARGLTVQTSDQLAEGVGSQRLIGVVMRLQDRNPALCTHGDVVQELLAVLIEQGIIARAQAANEKGGTWVIDLIGGQINGARYLPAP